VVNTTRNPPAVSRQRSSATLELQLSIQFGKGANAANWPLSAPRMRRMILAALTQQSESATVTVATVGVVIVGESEGRRLNVTYRKKDYATNVLTFDYTAPPELHADIVICQPIIRKEARSQGKKIDHHAAHLLIHGVLHACGLDHQKTPEAEKMEALEAKILQRFRIPNPYSP
jgi:probable rRNA maturation factor